MAKPIPWWYIRVATGVGAEGRYVVDDPEQIRMSLAHIWMPQIDAGQRSTRWRELTADADGE